MDWNYLKERLLSVAEDLMWAIIVLVIGHFIVQFICKRLPKSKLFKKMEPSARSFITSTIQMVLYVLLVIVVISILGIPAASIIGVLTSACLAIGLALQGALSNFAGGIIIMVMKPFRVGDYIVTTTTGIEGTVKIIGLIYTSLLTPDNRMVVIPNGGLANSSITNVTAEDKRRIEIQVGISYESDLRRAKELLLQILDTHPMALHEEDRMPQVFVWELGSNSVVLGGRVWSKMEDYWTVKFEITEQIKLTFDREGIEIPYQRVDIKVAGLETGEKK